MIGRLPAYFQAMQKRLDKSARDNTGAERALPLVRELWEAYLALAAKAEAPAERLDELRWMIEEYRINAFAQPMKTRFPVSEHKIRRLIDELARPS